MIGTAILCRRRRSGDIVVERVTWTTLLVRAMPLGVGERWITVHPSGNKEDHGVPVLIRQDRRHPGTYHVVGGAGGKLNYLHLTHVKSEAEYRTLATKRKKDKAEMRRMMRAQARAQAKAAGEPDPVEKAEDVRFSRRSEERRFIDKVAKQQGWKNYDLDPEALRGLSEGAQNTALARHHRKLLSRAQAVVEKTRRRAMMDEEFRRQAGIGEVPLHGGPSSVGYTDLERDKERRGIGYVAHKQKEAKKRGLTDQEKRAEAKEVRDRHLEELEPEVAENVKKMVEATRKREGEIRGAKAAGLLDAEEPVLSAAERDEAMDLLVAEKQLRDFQTHARRRLKAVQGGKEVQAEAFVVKADEQLREEVQNDLRQQHMTDQARTFLSEVERRTLRPELDPEGPMRDKPGDLTRHQAAGAHAALDTAALTLTGQSLVPREVVDTLGTSGAAIIMVRSLRMSMGPGELKQARDALDAYHVETVGTLADEAMKEADGHYDAAKEIELGMSHHPGDVAVQAEMNRKRLRELEAAREALGVALGRMEGAAALNMALRENREEFKVSMGAMRPEDAIASLRAIGLEKDDYSLDSDGTNQYVTVKSSGMDRLATAADPVRQRRDREVMAIKRGEADEEGWLPQGFAKRPSSSYLEPEFERASMAEPPDFTGGVKEGVEGYVVSRIADGQRPADILHTLLSDSFMRAHIPDGKRGDFMAAVNKLIPLTKTVKEGGKERVVNAKAEEALPALERMATQYAAQRYGPDKATFHTQSIEGDTLEHDRHLNEAVHRALAADPRAKAAFKPPAELTSQDQAGIRSYFYDRVSPAGPPKAVPRVDLAALGPEPTKMAPDLFGGESVTSEWSEWDAHRQELAEAANPSSAWKDYVAAHHGLQGAYGALQDQMKSEFIGRFAPAYRAVTKQPLKVSTREIRGAERHLGYVDPEQREAFRRERAQLADLARNRIQGRYAEGGVKARMDRILAQKGIEEENQASLFDMEAPVGEVGKVEARPGERLALGQRAEAELTDRVAKLGAAFRDHSPVSLPKDLSMSGRFVEQQRSIKAFEKMKKMGVFAGVGSGKTNIAMGAFTDLHAKGKVKRGLFVVPSQVQGQFGSEAARFLEPGAVNFHAVPGESREGRFHHYGDAGTHAIAVTHQGFRDDVVRMVASHTGQSTEKAAASLRTMPDAERDKLIGDAMKAHGFSPDYVAVDEGHVGLNRAGKKDSLLAKVMDSVYRNSTYAMAMTGDPVKNDPSEIHDWLRKLAPEEAGSREEFMRKYGINTSASAGAMKRAVAPRFYMTHIQPPVHAERIEHKVPLTPHQKTAYAGVLKSFNQARSAAAAGGVDVEAVKALSPGSFVGLPKDKEEARAKQLMPAIGVLKNAALSRVVNQADGAHNAKIQALLKVADTKRADGQPGVVFAHHRKSVREISDALKAAGHRVVTLTGSDSAKEKDAKRRAFRPDDQSEPSADILVASDAGATGLNLQRGTWLWNHDTPDTAMTHNQRQGRINRLGQKHDVEIYDARADVPFEERAKERLDRKYQLADTLRSHADILDDTGLAGHLRAVQQAIHPDEGLPMAA